MPALEDKIVQKGIAGILEAIYEAEVSGNMAAVYRGSATDPEMAEPAKPTQGI